MNFQPSKRAANGVGVIDHLFLKFRQLGILIGNSEPASSIDVFNRVTITAQLANQFGDALHGFSKRLRAVICEPMCTLTPATLRCRLPEALA